MRLLGLNKTQSYSNMWLVATHNEPRADIGICTCVPCLELDVEKSIEDVCQWKCHVMQTIQYDDTWYLGGPLIVLLGNV